MNLITSFSSKKLKNSAHKLFHEELLENLKASDAVMQKLGSMVTVYESALVEEDRYHKLAHKSLYTEKIAESCKVCSTLYVMMKSQVGFRLKMTADEEELTAAKRLDYFLKMYAPLKGRSYINRLSLFKSLSDDILTTYKEDAVLLGISDMAEELKKISTTTSSYATIRMAEKMSIPNGALKSARNTVDSSYKNLVLAINGLMAMSTDKTEFQTVIDFFNAQIRRYSLSELNSMVGKEETPATDSPNGSDSTGSGNAGSDSWTSGDGGSSDSGSGSGSNDAGSDSGTSGDGGSNDSGNGSGSSDSGSGGGSSDSGSGSGSSDSGSGSGTDDDSPFHP